jgi:dTDP-4-dehydrorhamnose reductase
MRGSDKKRVVVLGATGMLGSMVADWLERDPTLEVATTVRSAELGQRLAARLPRASVSVLDVTCPSELAAAIRGAQWIVNAIGITKPYVRDDVPHEVERAVRVNALFPHVLVEAAASEGARVLQIATDCVFSGREGGYAEGAGHDPLDVYGKTKSLGEARAAGVHHLRCSIVGPEPRTGAFLLEWLRRQPQGATVPGFTDHRWNGVTTLQFARLCHAIVRDEPELPPLMHVVPTGAVTKRELLELITAALGRVDVVIRPVASGRPVNRTLVTVDPARNCSLWAAAGYPEPPDVPSMLNELAEYGSRLEGLAP